MYYVIFEDPITKKSLVVKSLFDLCQIDQVIKSLQSAYMKKLSPPRITEDTPYYPLDEEPVYIFDFENNIYKIVYIKKKVLRGWVYNSNIDIETTFVYKVLSYDSLPNRTPKTLCSCDHCKELRESYSKELEKSSGVSQPKSLIEALLDSPFFKRRLDDLI